MIYDTDLIKNRALFSIYEFFMLYLNLVGGIVDAFIRVIKVILISLLGLSRLDKPLFPRWILEYKYYDLGHESFLSLALFYHMYNNPVAITTSVLLCR